MSDEGHEKGSLLSPMDEEYTPSDEDASRIFSKIQASLAAQAAASSASQPLPSTSAGVKGGFKVPKGLFAIGLSCMVAAGIFAGRAFVSKGPSSSSVATSTSSMSSPPASVPTTNVVASSDAPPAAVTSLSVDELPAAKPSLSASAKVAEVASKAAPRPASTGSESDNDGLAREAALLADARQAEQRGDDVRALERLDEHARTFPNGWLAADRAAERIIVLCNLGRREEASREAAVFLQSRPKSHLTHRVATSCAGQP